MEKGGGGGGRGEGGRADGEQVIILDVFYVFGNIWGVSLN